jgi:hypothetical protein
MVHELAISTDSHFTVALTNVAVFRSSSTSQNVSDFSMRRPLHSDHFLLCCVFNIFSIPPVVPYPLRSPVSWPTEILPWLLGSMKCLAHLSDEVLSEANPHTRIGREAVSALVLSHALVAVRRRYRLDSP